MDRALWHCTGGRDQDHPQGKEMQKAKWLSEQALEIAERKREAKGEEKERYIYLNEEFQRIARRDKKAFLSNQWKEIEENYRYEQVRFFQVPPLSEHISERKIFSAKILTSGAKRWDKDIWVRI